MSHSFSHTLQFCCPLSGIQILDVLIYLACIWMSHCSAFSECPTVRICCQNSLPLSNTVAAWLMAVIRQESFAAIIGFSSPVHPRRLNIAQWTMLEDMAKRFNWNRASRWNHFEIAFELRWNARSAFSLEMQKSWRNKIINFLSQPLSIIYRLPYYGGSLSIHRLCEFPHRLWISQCGSDDSNCSKLLAKRFRFQKLKEIESPKSLKGFKLEQLQFSTVEL